MRNRGSVVKVENDKVELEMALSIMFFLVVE